MFRILLGTLIPVFLLISISSAGNLEPTAAPGSTMMTLTEVGELVATAQASTEAVIEAQAIGTPIRQDQIPLLIATSGAYYLAERVVGASGQNAITIGVSDVSINLNGFTLQGLPGSLSGVAVAPLTAPRNIAIRGGTISDWGASGINLSEADSCLFVDLCIDSTGSNGLVSGDNAIVSRVVVTDSTSGSGFVTGEGSVVFDCAARNNDQQGFELGAGNVMDRCTVRLNKAGGMLTGISTTIARSVITNNDGDGVNLGDGSVIRECTVNANGFYGIGAAAGCFIESNVVSFNSNHGIIVGSNCRVVDNLCDSNGQTVLEGAGINLNTTGNVAIGNQLSRNDVGLKVMDANNYSSRNIMTGNTVASQEIGTSTMGPGDLANIAF